VNLHALAVGIISAVNPQIPCTARVATGSTTSPDGTRVPTYIDIPNVPVQVQPLSYGDIQLLDGLQINGERRGMFLTGRFDSLNRGAQTGGDLITFPDGEVFPYGTVWKIAYVFEQWPDWCHVAATRLLPGQVPS
jgi:hypothetical protein